MFKECIVQGVVETDDLDWKEALPGREEARLVEFSKDVAVWRANSSPRTSRGQRTQILCRSRCDQP
jgi:hypothetical protein